MTLKPKLSTKNGPADGDAAEYYVLGGGHLGKAVAERIQADGYAVSLVDESHDSSDLPGLQGNPADIRTLAEAGLSGAPTVIVATPLDRQNLLIAQLVRAHFDVHRVIVLVNAPERFDLLAETGHELVCATSAVSDALVDNL